MKLTANKQSSSWKTAVKLGQWITEVQVHRANPQSLAQVTVTPLSEKEKNMHLPRFKEEAAVIFNLLPEDIPIKGYSLNGNPDQDVQRYTKIFDHHYRLYQLTIDTSPLTGKHTFQWSILNLKSETAAGTPFPNEELPRPVWKKLQSTWSQIRNELADIPPTHFVTHVIKDHYVAEIAAPTMYDDFICHVRLFDKPFPLTDSLLNEAYVQPYPHPPLPHEIDTFQWYLFSNPRALELIAPLDHEWRTVTVPFHRSCPLQFTLATQSIANVTKPFRSYYRGETSLSETRIKDINSTLSALNSVATQLQSPTAEEDANSTPPVLDSDVITLRAPLVNDNDSSLPAESLFLKFMAYWSQYSTSGDPRFISIYSPEDLLSRSSNPRVVEFRVQDFIESIHFPAKSIPSSELSGLYYYTWQTALLALDDELQDASLVVFYTSELPLEPYGDFEFSVLLAADEPSDGNVFFHHHVKYSSSITLDDLFSLMLNQSQVS
jgi:hypothetical protein